MRFPSWVCIIMRPVLLRLAEMGSEILTTYQDTVSEGSVQEQVGEMVALLNNLSKFLYMQNPTVQTS